MIRKIFLVILLWVVSYGLWITTAYAQSGPCKDKIPFATSYDVAYDITEDGITTVTEKINLRNLTSECYASQFKLTIGATQVSEIVASDSNGAMEVQTSQNDATTAIEVKFNQQIAGLDKTLTWTLQFKSKDFAEKIGKVWEVRAPKISPSSNIDSYNLTISVPLSFGEPTLISPTPKSQTQSQGRMFFTFDKSQLGFSGVSASFGTNQLFDFDLTYHLENNNFLPILTYIALPPDTPYQNVIFQRIDPQPINVTVDDDGNYLAWYRLQRKQKFDVKVIGSAKLYTNSKVDNPILSDVLRRKFTQSDKYWEKDNPLITSKLSEILEASNSEDTEEKAKLIFRYVVETLKYDSSRIVDNIERFGAVTALNNPDSAVCMEFTDLFIALARASGIPARELDGYAYTANPKLRPLSLNKDVLHAWPEYWDEKWGWVMVDPTWENTTGGVDYFSKLDLSHFVFAIKGSSSVRPTPAGSYKYAGKDTRDVKVKLSDKDFLGKPQIDVKVVASAPLLAGFPGKIKIVVSNFGNAFYPSSNFGVSTKKLFISTNPNSNSGPIPAFGSASFEYSVKTQSLFENYTDEVTVLVGGHKFIKEIKVRSIIPIRNVWVIVALIGTLMGIVYIVILAGFIYRKRFAKTSNMK